MEIRKHKIKNNWIFGEYDFFINDKLVAQLRRQLVGADYIYLYFLPKQYGDYDRTRFDWRYITNEELLEKAVKIVTKKLYLEAMKIFNGLIHISIEN